MRATMLFVADYLRLMLGRPLVGQETIAPIWVTNEDLDRLDREYREVAKYLNSHPTLS